MEEIRKKRAEALQKLKVSRNQKQKQWKPIIFQSSDKFVYYILDELKTLLYYIFPYLNYNYVYNYIFDCARLTYTYGYDISYYEIVQHIRHGPIITNRNQYKTIKIIKVKLKNEIIVLVQYFNRIILQ